MNEGEREGRRERGRWSESGEGEGAKREGRRKRGIREREGDITEGRKRKLRRFRPAATPHSCGLDTAHCPLTLLRYANVFLSEPAPLPTLFSNRHSITPPLLSTDTRFARESPKNVE